MKKETITMRVSVHPIKAKIWDIGTRGLIENSTSLRKIGEMIGVSSPQQIKHHLEAMVKMGSIDYINGNYVFPKV